MNKMITHQFKFYQEVLVCHSIIYLIEPSTSHDVIRFAIFITFFYGNLNTPRCDKIREAPVRCSNIEQPLRCSMSEKNSRR